MFFDTVLVAVGVGEGDGVQVGDGVKDGVGVGVSVGVSIISRFVFTGVFWTIDGSIGGVGGYVLDSNQAKPSEMSRKPITPPIIQSPTLGNDDRLAIIGCACLSTLASLIPGNSVVEGFEITAISPKDCG